MLLLLWIASGSNDIIRIGRKYQLGNSSLSMQDKLERNPSLRMSIPAMVDYAWIDPASAS